MNCFIVTAIHFGEIVNGSARSSYSKPEYSTSFNSQNSNSAKLKLKKPEKLISLEPKSEILEQNSSLIHVRTRLFETQ